MACWLETRGTATAPLGSGGSLAGAAGAAAVLLGDAALDDGADDVGAGGGHGRRVYTSVMTRPVGASGMGVMSRGGNPGGGPPVDAGEDAEDVQAARSADRTYGRCGVVDEG